MFDYTSFSLQMDNSLWLERCMRKREYYCGIKLLLFCPCFLSCSSRGCTTTLFGTSWSAFLRFTRRPSLSRAGLRISIHTLSGLPAFLYNNFDVVSDVDGSGRNCGL